MRKYQVGDRIGTLVIQEDLGGSYWWCKCDCGREDVYYSGELTNRKSCSKTCKFYRGGGRTIKHGDRANGRRTRLYQIWDGMIGRCTRESQVGYSCYGGRNIHVCDEWKNDYSVFKKWALENGYKNGLTIDRINNDEGYCPDNCRWATYEEQANNRRSNVAVKINGKKKTLSQLSKEYGINESTLSARHLKSHDPDYILKPVRKKSQ